jgi:hypothetical protein
MDRFDAFHTSDDYDKLGGSLITYMSATGLSTVLHLVPKAITE